MGRSYKMPSDRDDKLDWMGNVLSAHIAYINKEHVKVFYFFVIHSYLKWPVGKS